MVVKDESTHFYQLTLIWFSSVILSDAVKALLGCGCVGVAMRA